MNRGHVLRERDIVDVPRACGDEPVLDKMAPTIQAVFPAHAGTALDDCIAASIPPGEKAPDRFQQEGGIFAVRDVAAVRQDPQLAGRLAEGCDVPGMGE